MKWLIGLAVITAFVAVFVVFIRPGMRNNPRFRSFFEWIEPMEIALWKKSETILWARLKMVIGVLLTTLTQLGSIDITPLLPIIPDNYEPYVIVVWNLLPMTISVVGFVDERLRYDTTKPVELVAIPENAPHDVKVAAAQADSAKVEAVAVVMAEKGEPPAPPTKGTG